MSGKVKAIVEMTDEELRAFILDPRGPNYTEQRDFARLELHKRTQLSSTPREKLKGEKG